jgi:hypothetical protein
VRAWVSPCAVLLLLFLFLLCVPPQVQLQGAELCCGNFPGLGGSDKLPLPPLNAVVLDFPQSHLDPAHDVAGMLGQEVSEAVWTAVGVATAVCYACALLQLGARCPVVTSGLMSSS